MVVKVARKGINRFGVRKYALLKSETDPVQKYFVGKVRLRGSRTYRYICSCPDFTFRQKRCKHIKRFQEVEFDG